MKKHVFFCILLILSFINLGASDIRQDFINDPNNTENDIEFFYQIPEGSGPFPIMFCFHCNQTIENSIGGLDMYKTGILQRFIDEGIIAVAISSPGFGNSKGQRDLSGPYSRDVTKAVIDHFKAKDYVDENKVGFYGISLGAILASMMNEDITIKILDGGVYDLQEAITTLPEYLQGFRESVEKESQGNVENYCKERSAVYHADKITTPTLILHGLFDDRRGLPSAQRLHEILSPNSSLIVYPHAAHDLGDEKWADIIPFVRKHFFGLYDIGKITFSRAIPARFVLKIDDDLLITSGNLREGDAIMEVSPLNDDDDISVLNVPRKEFRQLILGPKGSSVRLNVLHEDGSREGVVIKRS